MSLKVDPREVLKSLNELGYTDISSHELKEFVRDLKRLIKYEQRALFNKENISPRNVLSQSHVNTHTQYEQPFYDYGNNPVGEDGDLARQLNLNSNRNDDLSEVFNTLHCTSTASSRAKSVPKKNSVISVEISKAKKPFLCASTSDIKQNSSEAANLVNKKPHVKLTTTSDTCLDVRPQTSKRATKSMPDESEAGLMFMPKPVRKSKSAKTCTNRTNNDLKPKVSFIRPRKPLKTCKSDPVALYQHYQEEWKKQKLPGEDKRYDLRWAIRERMLGEPEVKPFISTDKLFRKSSNASKSHL